MLKRVAGPDPRVRAVLSKEYVRTTVLETEVIEVHVVWSRLRVLKEPDGLIVVQDVIDYEGVVR